MSNISADTEEEEIPLMPIASLIPSVLLISGMIVVAVGGNLLIIISYFQDKQLQTVHNLYILNLAITDLFLGLSSMSFYAVYTVMAWHWPFGTVVCKIFLVVDFTLCLESVLLIIVISLDRLMLVTKGAFYTVQETFKVARVKVVVSWVCAFSLFSPAIIGWDYWTGVSTVDPGDCDVEFAHNFYFTMITSLIEFLVPFVSISVLNTLIYLKIRQRRQVFAKTKAYNMLTINVRPNDQTECLPYRPDQFNQSRGNADNKVLRRLQNRKQEEMFTVERKYKEHLGNKQEQHSSEQVPANMSTKQEYITAEPTITTNSKQTDPQSQRKKPLLELSDTRPSSSQTNPSPGQSNQPNDPNPQPGPSSAVLNLKKATNPARRDMKAARALGVLVLALLLCWAPYTITTIIIAFCDSCINVDFYEVLNWLLWSKSCINPFLYALNSARFRENIKKLFFFWRRR